MIMSQEALQARVQGVTRWLTDKIDGAEDLRLDNIVQPSANGLSHEIITFDAVWREGGADRRKAMVVRLDPVKYRKRRTSNLRREFDVQAALGRATDVPVPRMLWYESDDSLLGAEFYAMERIDGRVASDRPPYQTQGWVADLPTADRATLWTQAVSALAKIHRVPVAVLRDAADPPALNDFGQYFDHWRETYHWAMQGRTHPVADRAWAWLERHRPVDPVPGLSWGDARLSNMIWRGLDCAAVLDWEDVSLAGPQMDLGRWLFVDELHHCCGFPRLEGFGDEAALLALWESLTGYRAGDIRWFKVFQGCCAIIIRTRTAQLSSKIDAVSGTMDQVVPDLIEDLMRLPA